jgi:hypothetical protein
MVKGMMFVIVVMLMSMHRRLVAVSMAAVVVGHLLMGVLMRMLVFLPPGLSSWVISSRANR